MIIIIFLEISKLQGGIAIASGDIQSIKCITVNAAAVMTIENKTSYQRMKGCKSAMMYLGGFDLEENGNPFPYILVTKGGRELEDDTVYTVAFLMQGYSEAAVETYSAKVYDGSVRELSFRIVWEKGCRL